MAKKKIKKFEINQQWCKGCGVCVYYCPKKVLAMNELDKAIVVNLPECNGCMLCEIRCPDLAINIEFEETANDEVTK